MHDDHAGSSGLSGEVFRLLAPLRRQAVTIEIIEQIERSSNRDSSRACLCYAAEFPRKPASPKTGIPVIHESVDVSTQPYAQPSHV